MLTNRDYLYYDDWNDMPNDKVVYLNMDYKYVLENVMIEKRTQETLTNQVRVMPNMVFVSPVMVYNHIGQLLYNRYEPLYDPYSPRRGGRDRVVKGTNMFGGLNNFRIRSVIK